MRRAEVVRPVVGSIVLLLAAMATVGGLAGAAPPEAAPTRKVYDEAADGRTQIDDAVARAQRENKRVLVQWGGNWCPWCIRLHQLFEQDADVARTLLYEYEVVYVDAGRPAGKNVELAKSLGAALDTGGFPYLTVLDGEGKPVANRSTEVLEVKNDSGASAGVAAGHDPKAVLAFLKANQARPADAAAVLAQGLANAKTSGRRVFLHFGAPWCGWCRRLESWIRSPDAAPLFDQEFVDVKIDIDRMTGAGAVYARFNPAAGRMGIPWFAVLAADGSVLGTSTTAEGANIGFPVDPKEIEHFATLLRQSVQHLSSEQQAALIASLRAAAPKPAARPAADPAGSTP
ncbi:MAG: thioredoxin family protein [Phycisphaerales bacterium]|nr:thioredoxin family protein [Phycisphaerales bacterium]